MFRLIKNDDGIALMMVLVLLILVGGLTASLMAAGVFNIRFSGDEVDRTQAFYAADAGVEYAKVNLKNSSQWIEIDDEKTVNLENKIEFTIKRISDTTFTSEGRYISNHNNFIREIEFSFDTESSDFNALNFLRQDELEDEDHYDLAGDKEEAEEYADNYINLFDFKDEFDINTFEDLLRKIVYEDFNWDPDNNDEWSYSELDDLEEGGFIDDDPYKFRHFQDRGNNGEVDLDDFKDDDNKIKGENVVVHGSLRTGNLSFEDSFVIIRDSMHVTGDIEFKNSIVFIYGQDSLPALKDGIYKDAGIPPTTFDIFDIEDTFGFPTDVYNKLSDATDSDGGAPILDLDSMVWKLNR